MSTAVTDTRIARSSDRILGLPEKARQRPHVALAAVLALAAVVYFVGLSRSSLFMDEVFTWNASRHDLARVFDEVGGAEVTPPLYYLLLHLWLGLTGGHSELILRLPSALCGVGLVAAVHWLGTVVADRRVGLTAALLTALSPLVLQYAQEARAYAPLMLAATVAVAAGVTLAREPQRRRWLVLTMTTASAGGAPALHGSSRPRPARRLAAAAASDRAARPRRRRLRLRDPVRRPAAAPGRSRSAPATTTRTSTPTRASPAPAFSAWSPRRSTVARCTA